MRKALAVVLLSSMAMLPSSLSAWGTEDTGGGRMGVQSQPDSKAFPLPSLPYIDAVRWLNSREVLRSVRIDTLLLPQRNSPGPLYVRPEKLNASSRGKDDTELDPSAARGSKGATDATRTSS